MEHDLQGKLLVAHPLLGDGFFNRSVIYLASHNQEGAVGFSLNFKTNFMLRDVRPELKQGNFPIFEGGPVAREQLFFLHTLGNDISDSYRVRDTIYMGGDFDELIHKIEHGKIKSYEVKFFAGYSGWSSMQLEGEIKRHSWMVHTPDDTTFFSDTAEGLWGNALGAIKPSYSIFSDFNFNPSHN